MISTKLQTYLDQAGVQYDRHTHSTAYTSQDLAESVHAPGHEIVKSVILKADEGILVMCVLSATETANLDTLRKKIGCQVLRLASESEFSDAFPTCEPGAMPPFGNLFDVPVYCQSNLSENKEIEFNAGTHTETIRMAFADYERLVRPEMVHFADPFQKRGQRLAA
jgi:Ala-tRNA(Pro) deacylase